MHRNWRLAPVLALPALATALALGSGASAQSPTTRTVDLKELEKGSTFTHVRNTRTKSPRSNSQGDLIVFTNRLADSSGQVVGKLHADCVTTVGARSFLKSVVTCAGVLALRDGTLTFQAIVKLGTDTTTGAITGGTGAYANARGVLVSKAAQGGSQDTITLEG
jgi:allene oxide cyclase-like protein